MRLSRIIPRNRLVRSVYSDTFYFFFLFFSFIYFLHDSFNFLSFFLETREPFLFRSTKRSGWYCIQVFVVRVPFVHKVLRHVAFGPGPHSARRTFHQIIIIFTTIRKCKTLNLFSNWEFYKICRSKIYVWRNCSWNLVLRAMVL